MTRARDLADSADKDIAGTLTLDAVNASGVITGLTVEATGDTAAGDNAAMGYTSAEGLILTGQGSTNDVTIKNDADADVIEIPTGTTNVTMAGTLGVTGVVTANAGVVVDNITIDGTEIDLSSGDLTIDVAGDIILDADGGDLIFKDSGTQIGRIRNASSGEFTFQSDISDKNMVFNGNDGGSTITALTINMAQAGSATFNSAVKSIGPNVSHIGAAGIVIGQDDSATSQIRCYGTNDSTLGTLKVEATTSAGATTKTLLTMAEGSVDFNPSALNMDFRVRSDSNDNAIFMDGGSSHVCLNTATDHGAVLNIETTGNAVNLTLACTDTDTGEGPIMDFTRDAGNVPGDGDLMGVIRFRNDNTNLEMINYATISSTVTDVTDGTEDGKLTFKAMHGGTLTEFLRLEGTSNGIVFNDDRALLDFRVASGANNHMLFVDADQNSVAIGNATANYAFHVNESRAGNYVAGITNDGNNVNRYGMIFKLGTDDGSGTNTYIAFDDGDGSGVGAITGSGGTITYATFTAVHPAILPDADNENGYAYGTLLDTTEITYSKRKNGQETERGIRYKVVKSASANSRKVLGAYAGKDPKYNNEHLVNVLGDGHILCNNSGGNIDVGDGICTSATAGIGQKATASPSMIIGIAQEAVTFSGTETKLVPVQYGLQQFTPWS